MSSSHKLYLLPVRMYAVLLSLPTSIDGIQASIVEFLALNLQHQKNQNISCLLRSKSANVQPNDGGHIYISIKPLNWNRPLSFLLPNDRWVHTVEVSRVVFRNRPLSRAPKARQAGRGPKEVEEIFRNCSWFILKSVTHMSGTPYIVKMMHQTLRGDYRQKDIAGVCCFSEFLKPGVHFLAYWS